MIDERKMKRELRELVEDAPEGSIEKRIYSVFLEYINRQQLITMEQIRFEQRMAAVCRLLLAHMAAGQKNRIEIHG